MFYFAHPLKSTAISFSDKIKNRAIWRDLLALPPKVFVKRIAKRAFGQRSVSKPLVLDREPNINYLDLSKIKFDSTRSTEFVGDNYLNGKADFLGTGWIPHAGLWQKDFKSGFSWNKNLPSKDQLGLGLNEKGADVKVPWEFGRMHQLLRVAFYLEKSQTDFIQKTLKHFRLENPLGFGVHWMSAMEVSIRAINLCVAFNKTDYKEKEDLVFLQNHFSFILQHLERKEGLGNNHYLANLTGLLFGLVYFPEWVGIQEKGNWIIKEFCTEVHKQFYNDGGNFEGSAYYHALSTEISLLGLACLVNLKAEGAVKSIETKIANAFEFLRKISKPNGELPQFGDNDSGRILPFSLSGIWMSPQEREEKYANLSGYAESQSNEIEFVENPLDISGIVEFGNALFGLVGHGLEYDFIKALMGNSTLAFKPQFQVHNLHEDLSLALPEHKSWSVEFPSINAESIECFYLGDFGIVVLKSEEFYLSMSVMQRDHAHRYRGHFHNDQLSIDLWVKGEPSLSDPGNITYTGDMDIRNALRSAKSHNAPYLGEEPNRFMDGIMGLFHTMNDTNVEVYEIGHRKIKAALFFKNEKIEREIVLEENKITIHDSASKRFKVNTDNSLKSDGYGRLLSK